MAAVAMPMTELHSSSEPLHSVRHMKKKTIDTATHKGQAHRMHKRRRTRSGKGRASPRPATASGPVRLNCKAAQLQPHPQRQPDNQGDKKKIPIHPHQEKRQCVTHRGRRNKTY